jgi:flagellar basal body-associated protein FliL
MAEETKKTASPPPAAKTEAEKKPKRPMRSILILAVIMVVEAGIFGGLMMAMRPHEAGGAQAEQALPSQPVDTSVELKLDDFRAANYQTGATIFYDLTIHIRVDLVSKEKLTDLIDKHKATIRDRLRSIVQDSEPRFFTETHLTTLKGRIQAMLDAVIGEGMVKEVLISECMPFKAP